MARLRDQDVSVGSPAYAGIDPPLSAAAHAPARFPRLRGDRPVLVLSVVGALLVPPPTRG